MGKLVWKIGLFCTHRICADMQLSEISGAEQTRDVLVCAPLRLPRSARTAFGAVQRAAESVRESGLWSGNGCW